MTGKQEILELVNQFPEDISLPEITSALQKFVCEHYQSTTEYPERRVRMFEACAGEFVVPDDFDDPLPPDIQAAFDGHRE